MNIAPRITPFLWFVGKAAEAAQFYVGIFHNSVIHQSSPMTVSFRLDGQEFIALNGGPMYEFTPAISFFVRCDTQAEVDYYYERLLAGGREQRCGWLVDQFGVSWQIIPGILGDLLADENPERSSRVFDAMLGMKKLDIAGLQKAYDSV